MQERHLEQLMNLGEEFDAEALGKQISQDLKGRVPEGLDPVPPNELREIAKFITKKKLYNPNATKEQIVAAIKQRFNVTILPN